jgi:hypothetical protein
MKRYKSIFKESNISWKVTDSLMKFKEAESYAKQLGWRLPTKRELMDAYDDGIITSQFIKGCYWTDKENYNNSAQVIDFNDGYAYTKDVYDKCYVCLVK